MEKSAGTPEPGKSKPSAAQVGDEGGQDGNSLKGTEIAHTWAKYTAAATLAVGLAYCVLGAGLAGWSHDAPFQLDANFALFAGFIVVAGAIERLLEPVLVVVPPYEERPDPHKPEIKEENERAKADRTLLAYAISLIVGILVSSIFGLYFMEAIGAQISGDKVLRGLDVFITALIITGGTKPLHDVITSIEKKKESLAKNA
jgi:hypothetical protein